MIFTQDSAYCLPPLFRHGDAPGNKSSISVPKIIAITDISDILQPADWRQVAIVYNGKAVKPFQ